MWVRIFRTSAPFNLTIHRAILSLTNSRPPVIRWLITAALIGGIALRLFSLDADPDYYAWVGYIIDEGRWVAHARELALFGQVINRDWLLHLLLAPLFQEAHYATFELLGVSIWTARLPTALSGCALLVVFWILLRHVATSHALLAGLALLAFEVDLIVLSRVAVPEMASLLPQLLSYGLLVTGRPSLRRLFAGGVVLLLAVATRVRLDGWVKDRAEHGRQQSACNGIEFHRPLLK